MSLYLKLSPLRSVILQILNTFFCGIRKLQEKKEREKQKKKEEENLKAYEEYIRFSREDRVKSDMKWRNENEKYQQNQWKKNIKKWRDEFEKWEKEQVYLSEEEENKCREEHLNLMKGRAETSSAFSQHKLQKFKVRVTFEMEFIFL